LKTLSLLLTSSILGLSLASSSLYAAGEDCPECKDCIMVADLNVEFKNNSTVYMNDSERKEVVDFAAFLKKTDLYAVIEGHTSKFATAPYNYKLSSDRANKVRAELIKLGVRPAQIKSLGFGESSPLYDNNSEIGAQKNRRVIAEVFNSADELSQYISSEAKRIQNIKFNEQ
jgi:outer membrane protein OmpA-like peptidoglycan-associated protein